MDSRKPPVLILGYRRPGNLRDALENLRGTGVPSVYVSIDGPPKGDALTTAKVHECQQVATGFVGDFPIFIQSLPVNRGVFEGVCEGVSWFLEEVGAGIILEDDVRIERESLLLAGRMLEAVKGNPGVGSLTLFDPVPPRLVPNYERAWRYSALTSSQYWGSTWEKWQHLVRPPLRWQDHVSLGVLSSIGGPRFARHWAAYLDALVAENRWSWEVLWTLTHWSRQWKVATSNGNWALHEGFGEGASSAITRPSWYPVSFSSREASLTPPRDMTINRQADQWAANQRFGLSRMKVAKRWIRSTFPGVERTYLRARGRT